MKIDLRVARNTKNELNKYRISMVALYESMKKVHTELLSQDCDVIEEQLAEMHIKLVELDTEITELKSLIVGLEGIISIYEKTEKKNITGAGMINLVPKKSVLDVLLSVPENCLRLFR